MRLVTINIEHSVSKKLGGLRPVNQYGYIRANQTPNEPRRLYQDGTRKSKSRPLHTATDTRTSVCWQEDYGGGDSSEPGRQRSERQNFWK